MSYLDTRRVLGILNNELKARYEIGEPIRLNFTGKPVFHILAFNPLAYIEYGFIRNRAPNLAGSLALRAFLSAPHPNGGASVFAGVQAGREAYGLPMDFYDPGTIQTINYVAKQLGHPDISFNPV